MKIRRDLISRRQCLTVSHRHELDPTDAVRAFALVDVLQKTLRPFSPVVAGLLWGLEAKEFLVSRRTDRQILGSVSKGPASLLHCCNLSS